MARVLINEPNLEVRDLLVRVVTAIGFVPLVAGKNGGFAAHDVDILLVEPGFEPAWQLVRHLRAERPELPLVCTSIYPPSPEVTACEPAAYLVKPFSVAELQRALREAAATGAGDPRTSAPPSDHRQ